jgi:hypothetical protein
MCRKMNYLVSLLLVLTLAGAGMSQGIDPNLVGWWKLDEGTGTITLDETDYWNDGTLYGGPLWIDGRIGGALDFDGTDDYVDCGNSDSLNITGQITMAAWINTRTAANSQHQHYLGKGNNSYCIKQNSGNNLEVVIYIGGWKVATHRIDESFGNEWHHMVGTYDGSSIKLYLDSELLATTNQTGAIGTNADPVRIGTRDGTRWYHTGGIDDARIYNRAISAVEVKKLASPERASNPIPADDSVTTNPELTLQWDAGLNAVTHNLYFSDDEQAVIDGTAPLTTLDQTSYGPLTLELGKTYSWRVDEIEADGTTINTGELWSFTIQPLSAYNPTPANGAKYVDINADLAWSPGFNAVSHDIYFGTDREAMLNADYSSPEYKGNQTELTLDIDTLEHNTVYYWQVDEHNNDMTITNGELWSFRTIPETPITDPNLVGWWKLDDEEGKIALDWSGYGNNGSIVGEPQWITGQFEGALTLDGIDDCIDIGNPPSLDINDVVTVMAWVKMEEAGNSANQSFVTKGNDSYGLRHAASNNIQFRLNDTTLVDTPVDNSFNGVWHHVVGTCDGNQLQIYIDGTLMNTTVGSGTVPSSIYNVNIGRESVGNRYLYFGAIDDVQIYNRVLTPEEIQNAVRGNPLLAWNPGPGNGELLDLIAFDGLSWTPGDAAAEHDVYFGIDKESVADADTSTADIYRGRQQGTTFTINEGVQANQSYFWRIDEINNDAAIIKGGIWTFTIADYLIVDDFESYNDLNIDQEGNNRIYLTWLDGFENPTTNGSTMGYPEPDFAEGEHFVETETVHGGGQSAPIFYDNTTAGSSEVTANTSDLPIGTDWTVGSPDTLSLWIYGDPNNSTTERMYLKVNNVKVVYDGELTVAEWQQWTIDLATLGVNLNNVTTMSIGFERTGATGGTGMVFVDDIRLLFPADEQAVLEQ